MELSTFTKDREQYDSSLDIVSTTETDCSKRIVDFDDDGKSASVSVEHLNTDGEQSVMHASEPSSVESTYKKHLSTILLVLALLLVLAVMQTPIPLYYTDEVDDEPSALFGEDVESCSVCIVINYSCMSCA